MTQEKAIALLTEHGKMRDTCVVTLCGSEALPDGSVKSFSYRTITPAEAREIAELLSIGWPETRKEPQ